MISVADALAKVFALCTPLETEDRAAAGGPRADLGRGRRGAP